MTSELAKTPLYRHTMERLESLKRANSQGDDFWIASEIHHIFGYPAWGKFLPVIDRAIESLSAGGVDSSHHIAETSRMMKLGNGAMRRGKEFFLSRGACYLIAMNGDPGKPEIAGAQHYFAVQTRNAELATSENDDRHRIGLRERVTDAFKRVSSAAKDAGVGRYDKFHAARYRGLYDASRTQVEKAKGLKDGEQLFDRAGALELAANEFQMQLAATKIVNEGINGEDNAIAANFEVAKDVRKTVIAQSNVKLEELPLEREHIASVKNRLKGTKSLSDRG